MDEVIKLVGKSESEPEFVEKYGKYNIVRYQDSYFALRKDLGPIAVDELEFKDNPPGIYIGNDMDEVIKLVGKSESEPEFVEKYGKYNIVRYQDSYFALRKDLGQIAVDELEFKDNPPGIYIGNDMDEVIKLVGKSESEPEFVEKYGKYNIVRYQDSYFALRKDLGQIAVDELEFKDNPPGIYIGNDMDEVIRLVGKSESEPELVEKYGKYNIVRYQDSYFALRRNLGPIAVDELEFKDNPPGIYIGNDMDEVIKLIGKSKWDRLKNSLKGALKIIGFSTTARLNNQ